MRHQKNIANPGKKVGLTRIHLEEDVAKTELITLYMHECLAYMGEDTAEQHRAQQIRLGDLFPQSQVVQADARLSAVDCRFAICSR